MKANEKIKYDKARKAIDKYRKSLEIRLNYTKEKVQETKDVQVQLVNRMLECSQTYRSWYRDKYKEMQQRKDKYEKEMQELTKLINSKM